MEWTEFRWKWASGHLLIAVAAALLPSSLVTSAGAQSRPGPPQTLRCEYWSNPLGIDVRWPRLSWQLNDRRRGARQTAYRILVASAPALLSEGKTDIWDSDKVASSTSAHVAYAGPALQSRRRYFWKVRTWDAGGQASPYSDAAWWEMGLLEQNAWQAEWIGRPLPPQPARQAWPWGDWIWHPTEKGIDHPVFFRKKFKLAPKARVARALMRITADNRFTAYLNAKEIGRGDRWEKIFEFDVTESLHPGENLIAIRAANSLGEICGLLFSLKISLEDGGEILINTDGSWKTRAAEKAHWQDPAFSDASWPAARVIEPYGGPEWGKVDGETYVPPRAIQLRKSFGLKRKVRRARVYATGLGGYVLYANGERLSHDVFTPGWTDYPTRIQYQTYDVTDRLRVGENAIGAVLGNLWWSSGLGWKGANVYSKGPLRLLLQLEVEFDDGGTTTIISDGRWRTRPAPILENTIYHGETYDARLAQPGWCSPGFVGTGWAPATVLERSDARLVAQQGPPLRITEELQPVRITPDDSGRYIFDMGQNMVGWVRLKVRGPAGTKITLRFAELLQPDGRLYRENLRRARATDVYILRGEGEEIWEPRFTYHGFRYVELSGYPEPPTKETLTGCVVHSDAPVTGHFSSSNDLLNRIYHNITWGQRGNMYSVPTDCPQRDERLGWMGDAQIFAPTASYNRNMAHFFTKWERDILDCQDPDGAVHDVNPAIVVSGPAKPGWGDAVVIIPWVVYRFYGDKRIIEESYDGMAAWVEYMRRHSKGNLYERKGYGDWVAVVKTPTKPIGAAYFYECSKLLAQMARVIGRTQDAGKYAKLAQDIAIAYQKRYFEPQNGGYRSGTQTANLLPLAFGITPPVAREAVIRSIAEDVRRRENHLSTGFLGTRFLLPILSEAGLHELAYRVASQRSYPSWGYMVEKGATTIWELWNSDTQGPGMNSRNHFALGSVGEWLYAYLAGIRPDADAPGFKHVIIAPRPAGDLDWAEGRIETAYGTVATRWDRTGERFELAVTLPPNTSAAVHLPRFGPPPTVYEGTQRLLRKGKPDGQAKGIVFEKLDERAAVFEIGAGTYRFRVDL